MDIDAMGTKIHNHHVPQSHTTTRKIPQASTKQRQGRLTIELNPQIAEQLQHVHEISGIPKVRLIEKSLEQTLPVEERKHA